MMMMMMVVVVMVIIIIIIIERIPVIKENYYNIHIYYFHGNCRLACLHILRRTIKFRFRQEHFFPDSL
jgi:hypothetical protein